MFAGDRLFDAQGRYYGLIERSGGELVEVVPLFWTAKPVL